MQKPRKSALAAAAGLGLLALLLAGYPVAWLTWSPKSPLHSEVTEYIMGFGAGVGVTLGTIAGVLCARLAWHAVARSAHGFSL